jgi:uncharacterized membrane protein YjgN (DUF898 family)
VGKSAAFRFDGGAAGYLGVRLLASLLTLVTLGLAAPWSIVFFQRWKAKHTYIHGQRLVFLGSGWSLWGHYIKWWFLMLITLGIYGLWVVPRMIKWTVENTDFAR